MERIVPREKWLYDDRGMMKWMGWLLSDHSAFMEQERHKQLDRLRPVNPEMTPSQIDAALQTAFEQSQNVTVQLDTLENDQYVPEVTGLVIGFNAGQLYLQLKNDGLRALALDEIRCVAVIKSERWW